MTKVLRAAMAVAISASLVSCGKDAAAPTQALNQAASLEIFSELLAHVFLVGLGGGSFGTPEYAAVPLVMASGGAIDTFTETVSCDEGGSVTMTGTYDSSAGLEGTGNIGFDVRSAPNNCGVRTSQGVFRVNGNPNLRITYNLGVANWQPVGLFTMTWNGGYTWSGPGGSGGCDVSISYAYDWSNPAAASMSGHMCGYQF